MGNWGNKEIDEDKITGTGTFFLSLNRCVKFFSKNICIVDLLFCNFFNIWQ